MKVPNADSALIKDSKLAEYLLSPNHPVGRYKSRFFRSLGYTLTDADRLAEDPREISANDVEGTVKTDFGIKYVVLGQLQGQNGATSAVVTVWIILHGEDTPKLVTAYPGDRDEN